MELSSPPKPTRITQCLIPNLMEEKLGQQRQETFRPEDCFEQDGNESGAEAISLSALAGEVADAQKQQMNDLSKKLEILEELKVQKSVYKLLVFFLRLRLLESFLTHFLSALIYALLVNKEKQRQGKTSCIESVRACRNFIF